MRLVPLDCNEKALFGQKLNRSLCIFYNNHAEEFIQMWRDQGEGYWLSFCISFHWFLKREAYMQYNYMVRHDFASEAVLYMLDILTHGSANDIHELIKDIVSVARFKQLWNNILYKQESKCSPSYIRLFGQAKEGRTVFNVRMSLDIFLQAAGALVLLLKRWLQAEEINAEEFQWTPPRDWTIERGPVRTLFESTLMQIWGNKLPDLLHIPKEKMNWWKSVSVTWRPPDPSLSIGNFNMTFHRPLRFLRMYLRQEEQDTPTPSWLPAYVVCEFTVLSPPGFMIFLQVDGESRMLFFTLALLTLAVSKETLHPLSQFPMVLWENAFGGNLMTIIETSVAATISESNPDADALIAESPQMDNPLLKYCIWLIESFIPNLVTMKKAMEMNSSFHDSPQVEMNETSPGMLYQLIFNQSSMLSWLTTLFMKILQFEIVFNSVCLYPLKEESFAVVQRLYWLLKDGKMMTQCAILICQALQYSENKTESSYDHMKCTVAKVVPRLAPLMEFLSQDAYNILEVILENNWSQEEMKEGRRLVDLETNSSRRKINTSVHSSIIEMEKHFSSNFRSMYFWFHKDKIPYLEDGRKFVQEAFQILHNFLNAEEASYAADRTLHMDNIFDHLLQKMIEDVHNEIKSFRRDFYNWKIGFINDVAKLMETDGLVNAGGSMKTFWLNLYDEKFNPFEDPSIVLTGAAKEKMDTLEANANVYLVVRVMLGNSPKHSLNNMNFLLELFYAGCKAKLSEVGTKISILIQDTMNCIPCPPAGYFKIIQEKVAQHGNNNVNTSRSIDDALCAVEDLSHKFHAKETSSVCYELKMEEKVVFDAEIPQSFETISDWLNLMEEFRQMLLQRIASVSLHISRNIDAFSCSSADVQFLHQAIVQHHLVEEMSALRKMMDVSDKRLENAICFMELLMFRINWLNDELREWQKDCVGGTIFTRDYSKNRIIPPELTAMYLYQMQLEIRMRMTAAVMDLRAIFKVYLSKYGTAHPFTDVSSEIFEVWLDSEHQPTSMIKQWEREYAQHRYFQNLSFIRIGPVYAETLLDHCYKVWNIPVYCSDPLVATPFGSVQHAQQIISILTKIFMLSFTYVRSIYFVSDYDETLEVVEFQNYPDNYRFIVEKALEAVRAIFVEARIVIHKFLQNEKGTRMSWGTAHAELKVHFRKIWSELAQVPYRLDEITSFKCPLWLNNKPHLEEILEDFLVGRRIDVLIKLRFCEFMEAIPEPDSGRPDQEVHVANNSRQEGEAADKQDTSDKGEL